MWTFFKQIDAIGEAVRRGRVHRSHRDELLPLVRQCIDAREAVIEDCYSGETDAGHLHVLEKLKALQSDLRSAAER